MPWNSGVYTRGYPSWTNDASAGDPISPTKFDTEDNDFAAGLNNCLTKDGLSVPAAPLSWSYPLTITYAGACLTLTATAGSSTAPALLINANAAASGLTVQQASSIAGITVAGGSGDWAQVILQDGQTGNQKWGLVSGYPTIGYFGIYDEVAGSTRFAITLAGQVQAYEPNYSVAALANVATQSTGSFTGTFTGFNSTPTGTCYWSRVGNAVTLEIPAISATSNANTFTMTGLPSNLIPARSQMSGLTVCTDASNAIYTATVNIESGGVVRYYYSAGGPGGWTSSSNKGNGFGQTVTYLLT